VNKGINIFIVAFILTGPLVSVIEFNSILANTLGDIFPISMEVSPDEYAMDYREGWFFDIIVFLFYLKIFVIGIICLWRLSVDKGTTKLLKRFYLLIIVICGARVALSLVEMHSVTKLLSDLLWITILILILKRRFHVVVMPTSG